jgi:hypothetical protein
MPFARRRCVDLHLSTAAARRLIPVGGGARFSAARWRRSVLRLLTQFHTFCSVYFYSFTSKCLHAFYLLFNRQAYRYNLWVVQSGTVPTTFQSGGDRPPGTRMLTTVPTTFQITYLGYTINR